MARNYTTPMSIALMACTSLTGAEAMNHGTPTIQQSCVAASPLVLDYVVEQSSANWIEFQILAQRWKMQRGVRSSITEAAMMEAYQGIIGMGESAIKPIIAQLKSEGDEPDQWFWALTAITHANPVKPEDQGNFAKMAQAWIGWAEEHDYAG